MLKACHCCGLIHQLPALEETQVAYCSRCDAALNSSSRYASARTAAAALGAFFLYWPAILLPILDIEKLGHHHDSSLLAGTLELLQHGNYFVGSIVLLFSIVFPLFKIVMLLELSLVGLLHRRHQALTYRIMESVGKWSMLDVLLLAFMVMLVKLGDLVRFELGPAVFAFVGCVVMSMIASLSFDPHQIWQAESDDAMGAKG